MCDKAADNYYHTLKRFAPEYCKTKKMCHKAVNTYPSAIQFVLECCKTQEICAKAVNTSPFVFDSLPD